MPFALCPQGARLGGHQTCGHSENGMRSDHDYLNRRLLLAMPRGGGSISPRAQEVPRREPLLRMNWQIVRSATVLMVAVHKHPAAALPYGSSLRICPCPRCSNRAFAAQVRIAETDPLPLALIGKLPFTNTSDHRQAREAQGAPIVCFSLAGCVRANARGGWKHEVSQDKSCRAATEPWSCQVPDWYSWPR